MNVQDIVQATAKASRFTQRVEELSYSLFSEPLKLHETVAVRREAHLRPEAAIQGILTSLSQPRVTAILANAILEKERNLSHLAAPELDLRTAKELCISTAVVVARSRLPDSADPALQFLLGQFIARQLNLAVENILASFTQEATAGVLRSYYAAQCELRLSTLCRSDMSAA